MSYEAQVYNVMIASPNDVSREREIIRQIIHEWNILNAYNTKIVLLPVGWETHTTPEMGKRPQELINEQIVDKCDLLVGVFWTRLGTPTSEAPSGTVEEIERHMEANKPTMLYFSSAPVELDSVDQEQYSKLKEFKNKCKKIGLYEKYDAISDFKDKFRKQLSLKISNHDFFKNENINAQITSENEKTEYKISEEAKRLLLEAVSKDGTVIKTNTFQGLSIQVRNINFVDSGNRRSEAKWEKTLDSLIRNGLIKDQGSKGEVFVVTHEGYEYADDIR